MCKTPITYVRVMNRLFFLPCMRLFFLSTAHHTDDGSIDVHVPPLAPVTTGPATFVCLCRFFRIVCDVRRFFSAPCMRLFVCLLIFITQTVWSVHVPIFSHGSPVQKLFCLPHFFCLIVCPTFFVCVMHATDCSLSCLSTVTTQTGSTQTAPVRTDVPISI